MRHTAEPSGLSNNAIAVYGERVAEYHRDNSDVNVGDVRELTKKLGGRIEESRDFITEESLHVYDKGDFVIRLPLMTSHRRDTFTIAHELGHYFLHYRLKAEDGEKRFSRGGRDRAETEANVFAAALLMPSTDFRRSYRANKGDIGAVSDEFGVSEAAASVRASVLGLD